MYRTSRPRPHQRADSKNNAAADAGAEWLHIVLAAVLVLLSLLNHGRLPGLSADSSASLGFVLIIGFGLRLALTAIGTAVWSVVSKDKWLNVLGASLFITALVLMEGWSGVAAPLIYLYLFIADWTMVQRFRRRT